ncbi:hypothetical protein [Arthrobacter sp. ZGTC212]|nr:hypothetical protein [Arthrobacter sp. ZGTC212]
MFSGAPAKDSVHGVSTMMSLTVDSTRSSPAAFLTPATRQTV